MCPQQPETLRARIPSLQRHIQTYCTPSFKHTGPCNHTTVHVGMLQHAGSDAQVRTGRS